MQPQSTPYSRRRLALLTALAWIAMIGVDFFMHAGLLAGLYLEASPFLLPPLAAFRLIPLGYGSLLLLAILLTWLMVGQGMLGWRAGAAFGMKLGGLVGGSLVLGLLSVSTAGAGLLAGWFLGQVLQLGLAGALTGWGLAGARWRHLVGAVVVVVLLAVITTVVLQSTGVVPTQRLE